METRSQCPYWQSTMVFGGYFLRPYVDTILHGLFVQVSRSSSGSGGPIRVRRKSKCHKDAQSMEASNRNTSGGSEARAPVTSHMGSRITLCNSTCANLNILHKTGNYIECQPWAQFSNPCGFASKLHSNHNCMFDSAVRPSFRASDATLHGECARDFNVATYWNWDLPFSSFHDRRSCHWNPSR